MWVRRREKLLVEEMVEIKGEEGGEREWEMEVLKGDRGGGEREGLRRELML